MRPAADSVDRTADASPAPATPSRPLLRELKLPPRPPAARAAGPVAAGREAHVPTAEPGPAPSRSGTPAAPQATPATGADVDLDALLDDLQPALAEPRLRPSALAVASALAWRLGLQRVSVGIVRSGTASVVAVSDSPDLAPRSAIARALEAAMVEATEHGEAVLHGAGGGIGLHAHRQLASRGGAGVVYSVPVRREAGVFAVLVFEQRAGAAMEPGELRRCEALAGLLGPALERKRRRHGRGWTGWLRDRGRAGLLLAALAVAGAVAAVPVDYRISAPARVEGSVQRVVVAPFDGYVESAPARAGDHVAAGQVLATLQESALVLERGNLAAERDELAKQYRRALAGRDRAEAGVLEARMAQVQAKVDLLDARIARTRITAPLAGVVLSGDLTRSLGAPVERGQVLFEVAPLDGHRVVLQAHERDVGELTPGLQGTLALAALPEQAFAITVERTSSAARTESGQPVFLVEARLDGEAPALRPGMEGVAKVSVEPRSLVWILTHRMVEWLQLTLWSMLP